MIRWVKRRRARRDSERLLRRAESLLAQAGRRYPWASGLQNSIAAPHSMGSDMQPLIDYDARAFLGALRSPASDSVVRSLTAGPKVSTLASQLASTGAGIVQGQVWLPSPTGADDAAGIAAVIAALVAAGVANVTLRAWAFSVYLLALNVTFPDGYNLIGDGNSNANQAPQSTPASTRFVCTAAGAGLTFVGSGGLSQGFVVDGQATGNYPITRAVAGSGVYGAGRTWVCVDAINGLLDNLTINGSQNEAWIGCNFDFSGRDNLVLDYGVGNTAFYRCEFNQPGRHNVTGQATSVAGPFAQPTFISWHRCVLERGAAAENIFVADGLRWYFDQCALEQTFHGIQVNVKATGGRVSSLITISNSEIAGSANAADKGIHVDAGCDAQIEGNCDFTNIQGGCVEVAATGHLSVSGSIHRLGTCPWLVAGSTGEINGVYTDYQFPTRSQLPSGQLSFPATQVASTDATTLDDYQEGLAAGSITSGIAFGGASVGITYGLQQGSYIKIGRLVMVVGQVSLTSKGSSVGAAQITGLPFAALAGNKVGLAVFADYSNMVLTAANTLVGRVTQGGTTIDLFENSVTGNTGVTDAMFTNTSNLTFMLIYLAGA